MRKIKNEFMTHWDGLMTKPGERILVLAATNRPFDLDEAIIRRFERRCVLFLLFSLIVLLTIIITQHTWSMITSSPL
jgi:AAA+ superfamily predicted ATPase